MTAFSLISLVDDDADVLDALRELLGSAGYRIHAYNSAAAFLQDADAAPNCVVTDVRMPDMNGIELLAELVRRGSGVPVVMLTGHGDLALAVRAMKSGATDVIEKPFDDEDFLTRIGRALDIGKRASHAREAAAEARERVARLTLREGHVLNQLVAGRSNKLAGHELGISPRTVEVHRAHIMAKMKVRSVSDLIRVALMAQASPPP